MFASIRGRIMLSRKNEPMNVQIKRKVMLPRNHRRTYRATVRGGRDAKASDSGINNQILRLGFGQVQTSIFARSRSHGWAWVRSQLYGAIPVPDVRIAS